MTIFLSILAVVFVALFIGAFLKTKRLEKMVNQRNEELAASRNELAGLIPHYEAETVRIRNEAQKLVDQEIADLKLEAERIQQHYEAEARKAQDAADALLSKTIQELEPLRKYESLRGVESEAQNLLATALKEATALRAEAQTLLDSSRTAASEERAEAIRKAKEIREQADKLLDRATRDAGQIVEKAHKDAEQIGGDAYTALRDKDRLEKAATAIRNIIEGYGDRYVIPTRSLIDDLASDFGHTEAGQALAAAREQTRRMVEEGQAADCEYAEANRRETAIRFATDAFNGRVDAILSRAKHDNYGTLEQEIRDAFALVNQNGKAFRDARVLPAYLDARLTELKWAVVAQELKLKEREEQRRIKEQIREEEKARREYERAMQEAQREEEIIKKALEKARHEADLASSEQRHKFDEQIAMLNQKLAEAEAKNQRALSMAQQTRKGNIYVISNIGSFGEEIFKIGMTRRLEPMDRIKELSDASVPFSFDVHAMIPCEDAPALECLLHTEFDDFRINKINYRKEFFRVPLERLRSFIASKGIEISFTMLAEAHEYRETQALNKMTPEEREKYHLSRLDEDEVGE